MKTSTKINLFHWINPHYLQDKTLTQQFLSNTPFPHIVLPLFFLDKKIQPVAAALLRQEWQEKESDLFQFQQTFDLKTIEHPTLQEFYAFFSSQEFIEWIATLTKTKLKRSIDMSGFIYDATDYLLPHDDRLEKRKIAYVLNLSSGFSKRDGGELEFFTTNQNHPSQPFKKIIPVFNTLTLFEVSPKSFHQVREVTAEKQRLSLGGWFHG